MKLDVSAELLSHLEGLEVPKSESLGLESADRLGFSGGTGYRC